MVLELEVYVGVSDSGEQLKWRLKANVTVMVFTRDAVEGYWKRGEKSLPKVCIFGY